MGNKAVLLSMNRKAKYDAVCALGKYSDVNLRRIMAMITDPIDTYVARLECEKPAHHDAQKVRSPTSVQSWRAIQLWSRTVPVQSRQAIRPQASRWTG